VLTQPAPDEVQSVVPAGHEVTHRPPEQRVPAPQALPQRPQWALSDMVLTHAADAPAPQSVGTFVGQLHIPETQDCPSEHARPQAPQWLFVAPRLVSQPLLLLPSQLPKPAVQVPMTQEVSVQVALALANTHARPQPLQCSTSFASEVSQPSLRLPLQLANPGRHIIDTQLPPAHTGVPLVALHARPQAPQLLRSVCRSVSQPAAMGLQSPRPAAHIAPFIQRPAWQLTERPGGGTHRLPHAPQLLVSVCVLTSQPLATFMSQFTKFGTHDAIPQRPMEQDAFALGKEQTFPQLPHVPAVVLRSVSHPGAELQSPKPARHAVCTQLPATHCETALAKAISHDRPHAPQFMLSVCAFTQRAVAPAPHCVSPAGQRHMPATHD
jgi:hypothetical protein